MKGTSEDTIYLVAGVIILLLVAFLIYSLIGSDCDALAKRSASNVRNAIETVATSGTYTAENPYPTFVMLCQQHVENPITLNPFDSKSLTYPEYMIYWEHFPESPSIAGSFVVMDESYPFTKNFAQIAAISYGSTAVFGTFGLLAKRAVAAGSKLNPSRVEKLLIKVFNVGETVTTAIGKTVKTALAPVRWVNTLFNYMAKKGESAFKYLVFEKTGLKRYLTSKTVSESVGKAYGYGILATLTKSGKELGEQGLLEAVEEVDKKGNTIIRIKMIKTPDGFKALVKEDKWKELGPIINELEDEGSDAEKSLATLLKNNFASPEEYAATPAEKRLTLDFEEIIDEAESGKKGFAEFMSASMDQAKNSFKSKLDEIAATKGMHSGRPVMELLDTRAVKELTENDDALFQIGMALDEVQAKGSKMIKKTADGGYELTREFKTEIDNWGAAFNRRTFKIENLADLKTKLKAAFKSGRIAMSGAERDSAMIASFESWIKKGLASDETPGRLKNLLSKFDDYVQKGGQALSKSENEELGQFFKNAYKEELKGNKVKDEFIEVAFKRLSPNAGEGDEMGKLGQNLFSEYGAALKKAYQYSGNDIDKAHEIATLALMWRRDPAMVMAMIDNDYTFDATRRLLVTNMESFMIADTFEQQLKYAYLKDEFAGCDMDNLICLNLKGMEQKESDMTKEERAEFEKAYKVSTPVSVKLEREGFIGGGIGQFILTEDPRFHVVSPCLAKASFYSTGECEKDEIGDCAKDPTTGKDVPIIMGKLDLCPAEGNSNYCYYPTAKAELAAAGFWGSLGCSIASDFLKLGGIGFLTQLACAGIEVETERETTWPFEPFKDLTQNDMSLVNCEIEKNPVAASKLLLTACCGPAKCDPNYKCLGAEYAAKNNALCGKPVCTLQDLANKAGMSYAEACSCQA